MTGTGRVTRRAGLRTALAAVAAVPLLGSMRASAARHTTPHEVTADQRPSENPPLKVMTYNLRFASDQEPNSWATRRPVMRELLRRATPHVIGTQEGLPAQLRDIESDLGPHYDRIGTGRVGDGGDNDEAMAVFYDNRRLVPVSYRHFWLSDTPGLTGSNTWGGGNPRMVTWVRFHDLRDGGRKFCILNTHLDNASAYARERAASLIAERIPGIARSQPLVVTGDFNAVAHENPVYDTLLGAGLVDTWDTAVERGQGYATHHSWRKPTPDGNRIDWILATPGVTALRTWVDTFSLDGRFASDHLPVCASLRLE